MAVLLAMSFLSGCTVGPNYRKPLVQVPDVYHGASENQQRADTAASFADLPWWQIFQDPVLQDRIRKALQHNYDLQVATERITAARAQLTVTRSNQYPQVTVNDFGTDGRFFSVASAQP